VVWAWRQQLGRQREEAGGPSSWRRFDQTDLARCQSGARLAGAIEEESKMPIVGQRSLGGADASEGGGSGRPPVFLPLSRSDVVLCEKEKSRHVLLL
jgi:hypothetical protein